jgi:hypothetical protein
MLLKHFLCAGGLAIGLAGLALGCAKGSVDFGEPSPGSGGNASSSSSGGTGGSGGSGGGLVGPCGVDCAAIKVAACQVASCNETTGHCEVKPSKDGDSCEDGKFCTIQDACQAGVCVGGPPNTCATEPPQCNEMACDEMSKSCSPMPSQNGSFCTPEDKCQINGTCQFGNCIGKFNDCKFSQPPDQCHVMKCNSMNGMCEPQIGNEGGPCTDKMDLCTIGKKCQNGSCIGGMAKDCSTFTKGCFNGKCNTVTGMCFGDPIQQGGKCAEATDSCNEGKCDANGKCVPTAINEGQACDDGLTCTNGTTCTMGACKGGTSSVAIYFYEEFASNAKGWTLGNEWQIGGATASSGGVFGPDPGIDHTIANQNNGVAGVVIGGNAMTTLHDYYWLTSPVIDTSNANTLYFEFWRWLNSDYDPFMHNKVEVFDGTKWVNLWTSGSLATTDSVWTKISYDISQYKNAKLQVRFGFDITSGGVFSVSSWNVDDVLISAAQCQ